MSKNIFTIFIILFSILLIRPHNVLAESMHNMNMEEDKQKQNDEMDMEGHDERKN